MQPSAKQLIESIDWSLQQRVVPLTADKWAASTLRSVHCLLLHLSTRVESEGQLLHDDNADARDVLARLRDAVPDDCRRQIDDVLGRAWREADAYPTVASLNEENEALRGVVDRTLVAARAGGGFDADARVTVVRELDGYVRRRLERDQPLFIPAFMASTF